MSNTWSYRDTTWAEGGDLTGYDVLATDGSIGKIDEASYDVGAGRLVVDTGFWIFGKKRLIPAGAVTGVDHAERTVAVNMTKDQVKDAPDYDETVTDWSDETSRQRYTDYYGPYGW